MKTCLLLLLMAQTSEPSHIDRIVEGWTVRVEKKLLDQDPILADQALSLIEMQLRDLVWVLPPKRIEELRRVKIVIDLDRPGIRGLQYHPDLNWLKKGGHSLYLHKVVHIPQARSYVNLKKSNVQPWVMLHEMAHAWHDQIITFKDPEILAAFHSAVESKKYEEVLHMNGRLRRHYSLTDHKEYFAEGTEAFVGTNDFFPFVRPELKQHDPELHSLLQKIWGRS
ncbi:MAG TPA: metallopeptidase [Planctomycetes bacterium]|nr:metallopeptidase [Planctomycetota bacterium]